MSEEMVSLALCPLDILAIPSSHPAITSFLPKIPTHESPASLYNRISTPSYANAQLTESELEGPAAVPGAVHLLPTL